MTWWRPDMPRSGKNNAWEQRGQGPKGREKWVGFLGRGQQASPPARDLGSAVILPAGLGRSRAAEIENEFGAFRSWNLTSWSLVATILMIFARINWPNLIKVILWSIRCHTMWSTQSGDHWLWTKSCLAIGIFIQYNTHIEESRGTELCVTSQKRMREIIQ